MKFFYNIQEVLSRETDKLTQKLNNGDISLCEYMGEMNVIEGTFRVRERVKKLRGQIK